MEKFFSRSDRISQELQKNIAFIIQHSLNDPRFHTLITVSEVKLSKDLSYAQVFVSFYKDNDQNYIKKIIIMLNKASGYIRKLLCKKMRLRIIPYISFYNDDSLLQGNKISMILNNIMNKK